MFDKKQLSIKLKKLKFRWLDFYQKIKNHIVAWFVAQGFFDRLINRVTFLKLWWEKRRAKQWKDKQDLSEDEYPQDVTEFLERDLSPHWRRVNGRFLEELYTTWRLWRARMIRSGDVTQVSSELLGRSLVIALLLYLRERQGDLATLRGHYATFVKNAAQAASLLDQQHYILEFAAALGSEPKQIRQDRKAFQHWFDRDAVMDRYHRRIAEQERKIAFTLERMAAVAARVLQEDGQKMGFRELWNIWGIEENLRPLLSYEGDSRVVLAAFQALSKVLQTLPPEMQEDAISDMVLSYIYRSSLETRQQVWIQCEALVLLQTLSPSSLENALIRRLGGKPGRGDDLFVRRRAVQILGRNLEKLPELESILPRIFEDPSPFVRQGMAMAMQYVNSRVAQIWLSRLTLQDPDPPVRASALLTAAPKEEQPERWSFALDLLQESLNQEKDAFVLRTALKIVVDGADVLWKNEPEGPFLAGWINELIPLLEKLHTTSESLSVRRWSAMAREQLWAFANPEVKERIHQFQKLVEKIPSGETKPLPRTLFQNVSEETLGRIFSLIGQNDFGLEWHKGFFKQKLRRGHRFVFRFWRFFLEMNTPSPDKRQAHHHVIGREFGGTLRAPSSVLAEMTATKVPGEPLLRNSEAGWRPYLPLVDELISSLDRGRQPIKIFTSEGITIITPPRFPWRRIWARLKLTFNFVHLAKLRNWDEKGGEDPKAYLQAIGSLGFQIQILPHTNSHGETTTLDDKVIRFFPAGIVATIGESWRRFSDYFVSAYENSIYELILFASLFTSWFFMRHIVLSRMMLKARRAIPLVIGGWGTRGKSGTERIKAALFNSLGLGIVSKTTGCEAMFLHAHPFAQVREMFLFRPYDKATIWEQFNLVRLSARLKCEVFLWECMALTPSYVRVLQRDWMQDDIATITNTYPDHEDLQGPAGIDIPMVMTNFIPEKSHLLYTEELMAPILREEAIKVKTTYEEVGWLQAGLLTNDVLERFPYEEHPYNIALVQRVGAVLDIPEDYAVKAMADYVILDIGVLKTYPVAWLNGRRLEFINGMSANERLGCLGNWTRLGFDKYTLDDNPDLWISTVVNNRADRVARSKVFARIVVTDLAMDRCFLIGSNLNGLMGYIREEWALWVQDVDLWTDQGKCAGDPLACLQDLGRRFRIPMQESSVEKRLGAMLEALKVPDSTTIAQQWNDPDALSATLNSEENPLSEALVNDILEWIEKDRQNLLEFQKLFDAVKNAGSQKNESVNQQCREQCWVWYERKIHIVHDYHATGNQIILDIAKDMPPGLHNRIMGLQNIKGTGLDFVYRWQAWETCYLACEEMYQKNPTQAIKGFRNLVAFRDYGFLCKEKVEETVEMAKLAPFAQKESIQAELQVVLSNLELALRTETEKMGSSQNSGGKLDGLINAIEAFLDAGDAVKRRKRANQIYEALATERISHQRAAIELSALNRRQKGGWLKKQLVQFFSGLRRDDNAH
ncbi:hypothetical protein ACQZV8_15215 [Magnetococcales bacterium HHB-1]